MEERKEQMMDATQYLSEENNKLRKAGCDLALAAIRVMWDHDALPGLAAATSNWLDVLAKEGSRP